MGQIICKTKVICLPISLLKSADEYNAEERLTFRLVIINDFFRFVKHSLSEGVAEQDRTIQEAETTLASIQVKMRLLLPLVNHSLNLYVEKNRMPNFVVLKSILFFLEKLDVVFQRQKEYLEKNLKEAEANLREMVQQRQANR